MTVVITQRTRRLTAPPARATAATIRKITQTNKRTYACHLSKDQVADLIRGELEQYHPEPTQQEWEELCESLDHAYEGGFR